MDAKENTAFLGVIAAFLTLLYTWYRDRKDRTPTYRIDINVISYYSQDLSGTNELKDDLVYKITLRNIGNRILELEKFCFVQEDVAVKQPKFHKRKRKDKRHSLSYWIEHGPKYELGYFDINNVKKDNSDQVKFPKVIAPGELFTFYVHYKDLDTEAQSEFDKHNENLAAALFAVKDGENRVHFEGQDRPFLQ